MNALDGLLAKALADKSEHRTYMGHDVHLPTGMIVVLHLVFLSYDNLIAVDARTRITLIVPGMAICPLVRDFHLAYQS